ncbi:MAG: alpha/beta hydrolase-fold protein [Cyclobacteriaceae bacterium]
MNELSLRLLLTVFCLFACVALVKAQRLSSGPQVLTFFSDADDSEQPYALYIPPNFDENKQYPLVIMLHGAGSNHRLALRRVFGKSNAPNENDVEASRIFPEWKDVDYIVAAPYARGTAGYQGIVEKDVYDMLDDLKKRFNIDENRVYLTGLSMGGGGTLWIGLTRPDIWAAMLPVCPAPPNGAADYAVNATNIPVHIHHGAEDPVVKPADVQQWVADFKKLDVEIEYTEYPGVKHNSWENAYDNGAVFEYFDKYTRNLFPDRVRFATLYYKYNTAYWVKFEKINPGTKAEIDAQFKAKNELQINSSNLEAFSLKLSGHSMFDPSKSLVLNIDGSKIKISDSTGEFNFHKVNGKWSHGAAPVSQKGKKMQSEGPIYAAFCSRHIYVYGTADNPSEDELKSRQTIALQAANWSVYRGEFLGRIKFFPRVLADKDVRPSDIESSNLILFGTKETNRIIYELADNLPMHLVPATSDYGLFYVFPHKGKYVAINSGLPWWTSVEDKGRPFVGPEHRVLPVFKDFILFNKSLSNPIAEGHFDHDWKLLPDDRNKIRNAGVVDLVD